MDDQARIVIVGGGIMGAGLLYHLAEQGCADALLIEKAELTSGSTWHAAGQCPHLVGNYNLAKIHDYGISLYKRLEQITGQFVSWHTSGSIRLALTQRDLDWFEFVRGIAESVGFPMEIIDVAKIRQLHPFVDLDGVLAGAWTPDDGHADPAGLCNAMARGARQMGARIVRHNRVIAIKPRPSGEWEVITEQGRVIAEQVVNAAGCYARQVARMVGADAPICNIQHHYLVTGPVPELAGRDAELPVIRDPHASAYLRQEQQSGLIGIYEHDNLAEAWPPGGLPPWESDSELFPDDLERLMPWLERAMGRMPIFEPVGIRRIVNGAIPHSADGPPLLGPVGGLRNLWFCCGSSFGIAQGAGCGNYLAQWMLNGDSEINMTGFDPRRFGAFADDGYMRAKGRQDYTRTYFTPLPGEELPAGRGMRASPLHGRLLAQGAVHTETFGWERPQWFSLDGREEDCGFRRNNLFEAVRDECLAVRERAGLLDLSGFAKFDVTGRGARAFLNRLCANRMPKDGGIVLAHHLSEQGRIGGEWTITHLADDRFYVLAAAAAEVRDFDRLRQARRPSERVAVANVTDERGVLVLAGPRSREILAKLTAAPLDSSAFRWLSGQEIEVVGKPVRALRVNYVGELGWELHPAMADLESLYDAVMAVGAEFGIANFGLYAVNSLRMEKAYRSWGAELTNEVTLLDADMARFAKLNKPDFVGKAATLRAAEKAVGTEPRTEPASSTLNQGGTPALHRGRDALAPDGHPQAERSPRTDVPAPPDPAGHSRTEGVPAPSDPAGHSRTEGVPPSHSWVRQGAQAGRSSQPAEPPSAKQETAAGEGQSLRLIYFEVDATDSDVRGGEPIFNGERCIGVTTSGAYGHYVRKSLGFGYVPSHLSAPGTDLEVRLLGERRRLRILEAPAHDPANERLRA